jgi:NADP-dependent 3-hydroxy acid dehydrogenase YdfG
MSLNGAQVVIIGGSSGIGLATAKLARQAGADVTIAGRSQAKLAQAQQELGEVRLVAADITNDADVGQVFEGLSRVDHVVVAAGAIHNGRIVDNDLATLRRIIDERIWGVTYVVRHAAPKMSQGSITFTSGGLSSRPRLGTAMLTTALAGVEAMTPRPGPGTRARAGQCRDARAHRYTASHQYLRAGTRCDHPQSRGCLARKTRGYSR